MFLYACLLAAAARSAETDPRALVQTATNQLFQRIEAVRHLREQDPDSFYAEIEKVLSPYIDYTGFSRGVMARYYRTATSEQRARFTEAFRADLVRTYSGLLVELDSKELVLLPKRGGNDSRPGRESVFMRVRGRDGSAYMVEYSMSLDDSGWRVRNLIVDGINLGLQFRSKFAFEMKRHRNDMDALIADWAG